MIKYLTKLLAPAVSATALLADTAFGLANSLDTEDVLIDVPAQSLSQSFIAIGKQCDISIVFPSQLLSGAQAPEINRQPCGLPLLQQLSSGANLAIKVISPKAVAVVSAPKLASEAPILLPTYYEELLVQGQTLTGSRLSVNGFDTSAPVDLITAPELANSGAQTLVEFLKFTPAVAGNSTSTAVSNGGNGTAKVTLRGLPRNNTLVLINGRRVAGDGLGDSSVDLNTIAPAAVERIEIYTDGASAIYGSDAIAGVVNIVLKDEFDGTLVEQYYGVSSRGDLGTTTTNLLTGLEFGSGSLLFAASVYEQDGLFSRDRDFSANADARNQGGADMRSSAPPNALIELPNLSRLTLAQDEQGNFYPGTSSDQYRPFTDDDKYNYNQETSSTSPSERSNLYLSYHQDLTEDITLYANAGFAQTEATITLAPLPLFTARENPPITVAADNLYNPFDTELRSVSRRLMELGNRQQIDRTRTYRFNMELEGFTDQLRWNAHSFWSRSESREKRTGLADLQRVARALGSAANCQSLAVDGCVPLNLFGPAGSIDQTQLDYIATTERSRGHTLLSGIGLEINGPGWQLPAGSSEWAIGSEWRVEETQLSTSTSTGATSFVGGTTTNEIEGSRRILEVFAEYHLPLVSNQPGIHSLDVELAARYSHYSDFGDNSTPKIGLKYRPIEPVLIRATVGEGFRAPSLDELHLEGFATQAYLDDPCAGANLSALPGCTVASDPTRAQFLTIFTGDTGLDAEKSKNTTVGLVWAPLAHPGLRLSVDWFYIEMSNLITTDAQSIIDANAAGTNYSDLVVRDALGNVSVVYAPAINRGNYDISGYDVNLASIYERGNNTVEFSANAVYIDKYQGQYGSNDNINFAGSFIDSASLGLGSIPRWKASAGLEWTRNSLQLSYNVNYLGTMQEQVPVSGATRTINSWTTHNLQLNYQPVKRVRLTLGVDNLFDKAPPFVASTLTDNFDAFAYNPKQQYWYGKVGYWF
ncbi:TonB-dependent receptor [Halioxenophilus aromaticivorans]|uniref:TonB-dependent receptor n=1 Tax=Halioxenophilus aromaticivorans TaxID=1306992 RepID=A0AAV3U108_9ALTE